MIGGYRQYMVDISSKLRGIQSRNIYYEHIVWRHMNLSYVKKEGGTIYHFVQYQNKSY